MDTTLSALGQAALEYARSGISIFPLVARGKIPLTRNGFKDATCEPAVIKDWWQRYPTANIGIRTGLGSRIAVLDIDPRHSGDESLAELNHRYGEFATVTAHSGGGGPHYYFACTDESLLCRTNLATSVLGKEITGVDFKANGGYIVAPPSIHPNGRAYVWELSSRIWDVPFAKMPDWLLNLVVEKEGKQKISRSREEWRSLVKNPIREGTRWETLRSVTGLLFAKNVDAEVSMDLVLALNFYRCMPPLPEEEVVRIVDGIAACELATRMGVGK